MSYATVAYGHGSTTQMLWTPPLAIFVTLLCIKDLTSLGVIYGVSSPYSGGIEDD